MREEAKDQQRPTIGAAFATLGVAEDADRDAVTRAYRRLARATHPDVSPAADSAERFNALTAAYRRALDAAPTPSLESTAPPIVGRTPFIHDYLHPSTSWAPFGHGGPRGPTIVVGPVRIDPSPRPPRR
jgi:hypothetical protein